MRGEGWYYSATWPVQRLRATSAESRRRRLSASFAGNSLRVPSGSAPSMWHACAAEMSLDSTVDLECGRGDGNDMYNVSSMQDSTVRGVGKGVGPEMMRRPRNEVSGLISVTLGKTPG